LAWQSDKGSTTIRQAQSVGRLAWCAALCCIDGLAVALFHAMTFVRKLIRDIQAGQLGAVYLALELAALVVTVVLAISWFWR
jgi:hypothetical protein